MRRIGSSFYTSARTGSTASLSTNKGRSFCNEEPFRMSVLTLKIAQLRRWRSTTLVVTVTLGLVLLAVPETATGQIVPVCDRTPEVRDAIVEKVSDVSDCGDVTEAHLAEIDGVLDLQGPYTYWGVTSGLPNPIPELMAGDFSGLSMLEGLRMPYNDLTTLPPGLFHGLSSLKTSGTLGGGHSCPSLRRRCLRWAPVGPELGE